MMTTFIFQETLFFVRRLLGMALLIAFCLKHETRAWNSGISPIIFNCHKLFMFPNNFFVVISMGYDHVCILTIGTLSNEAQVRTVSLKHQNNIQHTNITHTITYICFASFTDALASNPHILYSSWFNWSDSQQHLRYLSHIHCPLFCLGSVLGFL